MSKQKSQSKWIFILSGLVIAAMIGVYFLVPPVKEEIDTAFQMLYAGDQEGLTQWFRKFGAWGPALIILMMVIQMFLIVFPTWVPMIVAVLGYGAFWGVVISVAAVCTASTIGYFIGQGISKASLNKLIGEKSGEKLEVFVEEYGFLGVVLFRISPFLSNDAVSFIAGILKMGYWRYMAATLAGIVPLACAIAYFARDIDTLKNGMYWIGGAGVVLYVLYIWLDRRKKGKETGKKAGKVEHAAEK